ncbi:thiaminase/transcriptional activator TenA [Roseibium hamelinense]|uniref:Aminopyrimidine aminohydrolase n=1 Tax=Roseibium hamelinense TaxID=150831 RepID=A0A562TIP3_9HYPH|nr:thiaminase II [Roseibium hamelinense]MTI45653.1 thiaminase II [Roseibium hamelinense]TWI93164.1 thiaminase/transcriptional activator TenA [Roseibium hamelinense]
MHLFSRLKADASGDWASYVEHQFVHELGTGELPKSSFRHYLVQDYLFLIQFARAYALGIYKSPTPQDMRQSLEGVKAIMDVELDLHLELCASWGMSREDIENAPEAAQTIAYTRFVLEAGMAGDLLDLQVALAPCIIGYAEIGKGLAEKHGQTLDGNPYKRWIEEYSGSTYQNLAAEFGAWIDATAGVYLTEARVPRLRKLFAKASQLEADFWQMGLEAS